MDRAGAVWFDGYDANVHTTVILDDYYHHFPFHFLLRLLDRYPLQVPVKGQYVNFNSNRIFITSNIPLCDQYTDSKLIAEESQRALWRRFDRVLFVPGVGQEHVECNYDNPWGIGRYPPGTVATLTGCADERLRIVNGTIG